MGKHVSFDELVDFGITLLVEKGVGEEEAFSIAEIIAITEACGIQTHGAVMLWYLDKMIGSAIDPNARPKVVRERESSALIDCQRSFSQLAMKLACEVGADKAKRTGVSQVCVRNGSWMGALSPYLLPVVRQGFFAQVWAHSSQCKDSPPFGGIDATFSTNPCALAIPTAEEPILSDFSTSVYSMGKVSQMAREGKTAPEKVFLEEGGELTDDPKAVTERGGCMLHAGADLSGYKFYGLSLWCEALTAMAGGSANNPELEQRQSFHLTVIDPGAFGDRSDYEKEMKRFMDHVKSSRVRQGFEAIRFPGERLLSSLQKSKEEGVVISEHVSKLLEEVAERNGLVLG